MGEDLVEALQPYSSCDVADALVKLGFPYGGFLPGLTMWSPERQLGPTKIIGPAFTVKFEALDASSETTPWVAGHFVDSAPMGSIIFIASPKSMINACWGGLTGKRAQKMGVSGVIIDGRTRDLQELRDICFPVFARDVGTAPPQSIAFASEINIPIQFHLEGYDMVIRPNDLLIADLHGVVCVPANLADKAVELMEKMVKADQVMDQCIESGMSFTEASKHRTEANLVQS